MLRSRHGSDSSRVFIRFGTSIAGAIASIHPLMPNAVTMAPATSAECIRLGRVDPLFNMENRSFRIINRTEAEDEGCPSNIEHYCPRTKFTNISQEHLLPFIPLNASRRLLSTSAPIFLCVSFEISSPMNCRNRKRTDTQFTIYMDKWATIYKYCATVQQRHDDQH
jgi:hypothetical protein